MDRGFRGFLRVLLMALVLAGVVLLIHSLLLYSRKGYRTSALHKPANAREADTHGVPASGTEVAGGKAGAPRDQERLVMTNFEHTLRDQKKGKDEAVIKGATATVGMGGQTSISLPVITCMVEQNAGGPAIGVRPREVRITANRALFDQAQGIVNLYDDVSATGEDLEVRTDSVTFVYAERLLRSADHVVLAQRGIGENGERTFAMTITGEGFRVDMALRKMVILEDVLAKLQRVSSDFLVSERPAPSGTENPQEAVITSDGQMTYEHLARQVKFVDNVHVVFGQKELRCDQLTLILSESKDKSTLHVSKIVAEGNAELSHLDFVARGPKLEWQNVTQTCVLTGEGSTLETTDVDVGSDRMTFFRLNARFHTERPGWMLWKAAGRADEPEEPPGTGSTAPNRTSDRLAGVMLEQDEPVRVTWSDSMTYQGEEQTASFTGNVNAVQQDRTLSCKALAIDFGPELLFGLDGSFQTSLSQGDIPASLREELGEKGVYLSRNARVSTDLEGRRWTITDDDAQKAYLIEKANGRANVYGPGRGVRTVEASGGVTIESKGEGETTSGVCQRARWQAEDGRVTLFGQETENATVTSGLGHLAAPEILYDPATGAFECKGQGTLTVTPRSAEDPGRPPVPTAISWERSLHFEAAPIAGAIVRGSVEVHRKAQHITSDLLEVEFDDNMAPLKITATGSAVLRIEPEEAPAEAETAGAGTGEDSGPFALPAVQGGRSRWQLSGRQLIIDPPRSSIRVPTKGVLTVETPQGRGNSVTWRNRMFVDGEELFAYFEGDVKSLLSDTELLCGELSLDFDKDRQLRNMTAKKQVRFRPLTEGSWQLSCESAEAFLAAGNLLRQVIARRNVKVVDEELTLSCKSLQLTFEPGAEDRSVEMTNVLATDEVFVKFEEKETAVEASGDALEWDSETDTYVLTGSPDALLWVQGVPVRKERILFNPRTGKMTLPKGARPGEAEFTEREARGH